MQLIQVLVSSDLPSFDSLALGTVPNPMTLMASAMAMSAPATVESLTGALIQQVGSLLSSCRPSFRACAA